MVNPMLWGFILGQERPFTFQEIATVLTPKFSQLFKHLQKLSQRKLLLDNEQSKTAYAKKKELQAIRANGRSLEQLNVAFVMICPPNLPLKPNGERIRVNWDNLDEYLCVSHKYFLFCHCAQELIRNA